MALIKGKQLQDTSVNLSKLFGGTTGGGAVSTGNLNLLNGTITASVGNILINGNPGADNHAVNKAYVDSVATGLDVKKSVTAIYYPATSASGGTPAINVQNEINGVAIDDQDMYTTIVNGTPIPTLTLDSVSLTDGDRVLIAITLAGRQKVNGIYVYEGNQLRRTDDADNQSQGGEVSGGMFTFVEQGTVYADTGWVLSFPNGAIAETGTAGLWDFANNPTGNAQITFTQFSAAGVAEAGVGLTRTGTKFSVNYDNSSIGIDGADALYIKADGVTNAMLVNDFTTFAGDTGSGSIVLGSTFTIAGGTNGIDTSYNSGTLTINLDLSELATVGTIADTDFIAISSSGAVNQKITFANLKSLIGAASQLAIGVEGGAAASFDLDTDTLNFATGTGLTFTKSASTAGTPDTLTLTLSNNELKVEVYTGVTGAINAVILAGETTSTVAEVFSVTINGVALKKTSQWYIDAGFELYVHNLPYAVEATDEFEITYRVY
jgi:hypothetical protein